MDQMPQISDAEWEVMKVLWDKGQATAGEVVQALAAPMHWRPRTIKTLLARLVKKGAVATTTEGRSFVYRPAVQQARCVRQESRSFLQRVFGGAVAPAVVHLLSHGKLSPEEIRELKQILEKEAKR
jgi:BlaI family penicillinase repressor